MPQRPTIRCVAGRYRNRWPLLLRPTMVIILSEDNEFAAAFQENAPQPVRTGDEAEVAFNAVPGRVFQLQVTGIMDAVAHGQLQPTVRSKRRSAEPTGPAARRRLHRHRRRSQWPPAPVNAAAQVAVEHWHHFAIVTLAILADAYLTALRKVVVEGRRLARSGGRAPAAHRPGSAAAALAARLAAASRHRGRPRLVALATPPSAARPPIPLATPYLQ